MLILFQISKGAPLIRQKNKTIYAVHLMLRREHRIFIMRRHNTSYYDNHYALPVWEIGGEETPVAALVRKASEKLGIDIDLTGVRLAHARNGPDGMANFFFEAVRWSGCVDNREPEKYNYLAWCPPAHMPLNFVPHVKKAIEHAEENRMQ